MSIRLTDADIERLNIVRDTILKNVRYHYTIPYLAHVAGINEFKLKLGFKALFGLPVFDFLTEHRMKLAMELMQTHNLTISEIAYRCGYNYVTNFCAAFRRRYHISPSEYRRAIPETANMSI
jgi:AraC family transcriptional activator of pyochelin receptor